MRITTEVEARGAWEFVSVFVGGCHAGRLWVGEGQGEALAERLRGDARQAAEERAAERRRSPAFAVLTPRPREEVQLEAVARALYALLLDAPKDLGEAQAHDRGQALACLVAAFPRLPGRES